MFIYTYTNLIYVYRKIRRSEEILFSPPTNNGNSFFSKKNIGKNRVTPSTNKLYEEEEEEDEDNESIAD